MPRRLPLTPISHDATSPAPLTPFSHDATRPAPLTPFSLGAYVRLCQVPLIPVYTILLTLIQPIIGFVVGFTSIAYSVILESSADHLAGNPCAPILNTLGFTGLVPAIQRLGKDVAQRWEEKDKPVVKCYARMSQAQEDLLHCWSAAVTRDGGRSRASSRLSRSSRVSPEGGTPPRPYSCLDESRGAAASASSADRPIWASERAERAERGVPSAAYVGAAPACPTVAPSCAPITAQLPAPAVLPPPVPPPAPPAQHAPASPTASPTRLSGSPVVDARAAALAAARAGGRPSFSRARSHTDDDDVIAD